MSVWKWQRHWKMQGQYPQYGIGWHEARVPTIATSVPRAAFAKPTHLLKEAGVVDIPIVATNRINDPQVAETLLRDDCADMVSMARPFLADPDFMNKARDGVPDEINTCIACNQACLDHAFVGKTASCLVNPRACHETEIHIHKLPTDHCLNIGCDWSWTSWMCVCHYCSSNGTCRHVV